MSESGSRRDRRPGYLSVDRVPGEHVDIIHDLGCFPYPWADNSVEAILMRHVLEHVDDVRAVLDECWRILRPGGTLEIHVPHFSHFQAMTHPEHRHAFCYNSLAMFTANVGEPYTSRLWEQRSVELNFTSPILSRLFNRHKYFYTTTILAYLFPAYAIHFVLTPVKVMQSAQTP